MQPNERTTTAGNRVGNKILLSIPDKEYALILPHLEFLSMPHHLSLYEPDQPLEFVHFPNTGMVSLVIATEDGRTVEVGEVGREGFAGIQAAVGINRNQVREIVQIAGDGFRVRIAALQIVLKSAPVLQRILTRYAVVQGMQFAQTAACNRLHNIEQRLARWLLITQDRVDSATLSITHDFLATMLVLTRHLEFPELEPDPDVLEQTTLAVESYLQLAPWKSKANLKRYEAAIQKKEVFSLVLSAATGKTRKESKR